MALSYLYLAGDGLVSLLQFSVGSVESLHLDLKLSDVHLVLLLDTVDLRLVLGLNLKDRPLQLLDSALAALTVRVKI